VVDKDITQRKQMEKNVQGALDYAESIVATVREPLLVLDANLHVVSASRSFYSTFKVTPDETVGGLIYELGNMQWDIPSLRVLLEEILPKATVFDDFEVVHDFETIGKRIMLLNARRLYQGAHKTPMILLAIEDITKRKQAEKILDDYNKRLAHNRELKSKQQELEEFTYTISHDLKAPVVSIQGFAKLLQEQLSDRLEEKSDKYLGRIIANTNTMERLLKDLLELLRIGYIEDETENVNLNTLVHDCFENFSVEAGEKGVRLVKSNRLPAVMGRQERLSEVLANLVDNAIKYMPARDQATVEVGYDPNVAGPSGTTGAFYVRDNGAGIPKQFHSKIFKIFQRAPATAHANNSTGVGLTIVKRIIETHGGNIWLESAPDKETTFYFTVPLADIQDKGGTSFQVPDHADKIIQTSAEAHF